MVIFSHHARVRYYHCVSVLLLSLIVAAVVPVQLATAQTTITDLGTLSGGNQSEARGINDLGQVVGFSSTSTGDEHAFLWQAGKGMQDLGTLGGQSSANGVNDLGQVVGHSQVTEDGDEHAFLWQAGKGMQDLGTLGGNSSSALGINDLGQVVGESQVDAGWHAFLWEAGKGMQDLGTLGGSESHALAINNLSQVVGGSTTSTGEGHAFLWQAGKGMQDLGTLGGNFSKATGINNHGQVVGTSTTSAGEGRAFLWEAGKGMQDLGTLEGDILSEGYGINDYGQVVGRSVGRTIDRAFLWEAGKGMQDLGTLGGYNTHAFAINDLGGVAGFSQLADGPNHAVLWTIPLPALTPHQQINTINQIKTLVSAGTLDQGQGKALEATLKAAAEQLNDGNTTGTCNLLQAFVNQVEAAVKGRKISAADGDKLIKSANDTRAQLGC